MVSRLRAMSAGEIAHRLAGRVICLGEAARWRLRTARIDWPLYREARHASLDTAPLGLVTDGRHPIDTGHAIRLPGGFSYAEYSTDWHAGFQTAAQWPLQWAYSLDIRHRDDIGDARTNWELNRHGQFVLMAKAFYLTADSAHLARLAEESESWCRRNPFLHGIAWVSPMETAIRCINWLYAAAFLQAADPAGHAVAIGELIRRFTVGAANMAAYLRRHSSHGSSANNHLLVEMTAILLAGSCLGQRSWVTEALSTLERELPRQFTADGVNRESSLHYHAFATEAYLLAAHCLTASWRELPDGWADALERMARFIVDSRVAPGVYCAFGDDDEGHILCLTSRPGDYYAYIAQFAALATGRHIDSLEPLAPTLTWLYAPWHIDATRALPPAIAAGSHTYAEGGYSLLRRGSVTVGIDHAPLGFGTIAAHAHADALSVQIFADGRPLLTDPGTYIYNIERAERDRLRSTAMHNTVLTDNTEQSEILGPFLWGRRAHTRLIDHGADYVEAAVTGLSGVEHRRRVSLGDDGTVRIADTFDRPCDWTATFIAAPGLKPSAAGGGAVELCPGVTLTHTAGTARLEDTEVSPAYGIKARATAVRVSGHGLRADFTVNINTHTITPAKSWT